MAITDAVKHRIEQARARVPVLDHLVRMVQHYGLVKGNALAGAVTFFGFLSFFPILALAFAVIGYVVKVYPQADDALVEAIQSVLPLVTTEYPADEGSISIVSFQEAAGAAAGIGAVGVLYAGLGWISGLRDALLVVFEKPVTERPGFVVGKLRDLLSLALIGLVLVLSVGVAGVIGSLSGFLLELLQLDEGLGWAVRLVSVLVGLMTNTVLFYALFRLLGDPPTPRRALWEGALLGALGFEGLKQVAMLLIGSTEQQPAFAVFGVALVLVVWINYFSRVVMYAASWAHTSPAARARREAARVAAAAVQGPQVDLAAAAARGDAPRPAAAFAAGAASMLGLLAVVRRKK